MIIDGKKIAEEILNELKSLPKPKKFLAIVWAGEDPASQSFINKKKEIADELGLDFRIYKFKEDIKNDELRREVGKISGHRTCGGIIVQLPLPKHINSTYILGAIPIEKDVDVLGYRAIGRFITGKGALPPSVLTLEAIVKNLNLDLSKMRVAILGLGFLVGRPISLWLMDKAKEIILLDKGSDLKLLSSADLIISGTGQAGIISPEYLKEGCVVVDFGTSLESGKLRGDLDIDPDAKILFTPTPGGTGPILVSKIFENFYKLNINKKQD